MHKVLTDIPVAQQSTAGGVQESGLAQRWALERR